MSNRDLLENLSISHEIQMPERTWKFRAGDITLGRGISTKLDGDIWLDWLDVLAEPDMARMHMYPGESEKDDVGLGVKRMRMQTWQAAILVFNTMMVDVKPPLSGAQIVELLHQKKIPRPQHVTLPTENRSLIRLLNSLGIGYTTPWKYLTEVAAQNALLRPKHFKRNRPLTEPNKHSTRIFSSDQSP